MSIVTEKFDTEVRRLIQNSGFRREVDETCALLGFTLRVVVIPYHRVGTAYRAHRQESGIHLLGFLTYEVGIDMDS